jgi:hypothetical protein
LDIDTAFGENNMSERMITNEQKITMTLTLMEIILRIVSGEYELISVAGENEYSSNETKVTHSLIFVYKKPISKMEGNQ